MLGSLAFLIVFIWIGGGKAAVAYFVAAIVKCIVCAVVEHDIEQHAQNPPPMRPQPKPRRTRPGPIIDGTATHITSAPWRPNSRS